MLFSQTSRAGRSQIAARLTASWKAPWLTAPSPKKATATRPWPSRLLESRGADRQRQAGADDRVGAEHALGRVGDVHRAALAVADALAAGEELGHHPVDLHAAGQAVAVAAVGGGDVVALGEGAADARRDRLLAERGVDEAGDLAVAVELGDAGLEGADQRHRGVQVGGRGGFWLCAHCFANIPETVRPSQQNMRLTPRQPVCNVDSQTITSLWEAPGSFWESRGRSHKVGHRGGAAADGPGGLRGDRHRDPRRRRRGGERGPDRRRGRDRQGDRRDPGDPRRRRRLDRNRGRGRDSGRRPAAADRRQRRRGGGGCLLRGSCHGRGPTTPSGS